MRMIAIGLLAGTAALLTGSVILLDREDGDRYLAMARP
mgnify:CR=1 FL=1